MDAGNEPQTGQTRERDGDVAQALPYRFGDSDEAAERLALLAEVYEPTTWQFLMREGPREPRVAIDLGCGPGHTTLLLADALEPARTIGLDDSEAYLDAASEQTEPGVEFLRHDVTTLPFPTPAAEVALSRFLLHHLGEPEALASAWCTQLRPGGVLLLEEPEGFDTDSAAMAEYLSVVAALLAADGRDLVVGRRLAALDDGDGVALRSSRSVELAVPAATATRLFRANLGQWREAAQRTGVASADELDALDAALAEAATAADELHAVLRQVTLERRV